MLDKRKIFFHKIQNTDGNLVFIYLYLNEKKIIVVDMDLEPNDEYYNDLLKFWRKHKIYMGKEMMSTIAEAKGKTTFLSIENNDKKTL